MNITKAIEYAEKKKTALLAQVGDCEYGNYTIAQQELEFVMAALEALQGQKSREQTQAMPTILHKGEDIWYADYDNGCTEHGCVDCVTYKNRKLDSFGVLWDDGDSDTYDGSAFGKYYFKTEAEALAALSHDEPGIVLRTEYETPESCPECGEHLSRDWSFCPECGRPTEWSEAASRLNALRDDFIDFATGGVPNLAPFCRNRTDACVNAYGWCANTPGVCKGFCPRY